MTLAKEAVISTLAQCCLALVLFGTMALQPADAGTADLRVSLGPGDSVTFTGQGAGHGVGLSQWGARGRALAGQNAAQILAAYYTGALLAVQGDDTQSIRVLRPHDVVKSLPLSEYLASVVSSELPSGFPPAAVEAQAIASRTYALWQRDPRKPYDVTSGVDTQAFGATPRADAIAAVASTRGVVLTDGSKLIPAYFHDCSPAMTENNENVWPGAPLPYLRGIDDRDAAGHPYAAGCPREDWRSGPFSVADLTRLLNADPRTAVGLVRALQFSQRSAAGRWETATVDGDAGTRVVTLSTFRSVMNAHAANSHTIFSAAITLSIERGALPPSEQAPPTRVISYVL